MILALFSSFKEIKLSPFAKVTSLLKLAKGGNFVITNFQKMFNRLYHIESSKTGGQTV